ncbi:hypothetical protein EHS43_12855 [Streptomyces sp. RP5T]|nr:hypothetical protein EHS43_12855 [Streptomyces sp. RP5T]
MTSPGASTAQRSTAGPAPTGCWNLVAVPKSQQIKSLAGIWRIDQLIDEAPGDAWQEARDDLGGAYILDNGSPQNDVLFLESPRLISGRSTSACGTKRLPPPEDRGPSSRRTSAGRPQVRFKPSGPSRVGQRVAVSPAGCAAAAAR